MSPSARPEGLLFFRPEDAEGEAVGAGLGGGVVVDAEGEAVGAGLGGGVVESYESLEAPLSITPQPMRAAVSVAWTTTVRKATGRVSVIEKSVMSISIAATPSESDVYMVVHGSELRPSK